MIRKFVCSQVVLALILGSVSSVALGHGGGEDRPRPPGSGYGHRPGPGGAPGHGDHHGGPGRGRPPEHRRRQPIPRPLPRSSDEEDIAAAQLFGEESRNLNCENLGDSLIRLSNRMLGMREWVKDPMRERLPPPGWRRGMPVGDRDRMRQKWSQHFQSRIWWERLWNHVLEAYRACDVDCFEDGTVIGQISAAGYCGMSLGLEGLEAPGVIAQTPLPVCETATYAGCVDAYRQTAKTYEGCSLYTSGRYQETFNGFVSQDCQMN